MVGLIVGPVQFFLRRLTPPERAERLLPVHRWLGRTYLVSAAFAGIGGLYLSAFVYGGFAASVGFGTLAVMFLGTTTVAYIRIRAGNEASHREWMTRSYALMISIVLMRIYLVIFLAAGVDLQAAYAAMTWIGWVPTLVVAEWLIAITWRRWQVDQKTA